MAEGRGCAAIIRTAVEWQTHPQGRVVGEMPAVVASERSAGQARWSPSLRRPLDGLRVLDLTRVLAGPTAGRTLAAFDADVVLQGWRPGIVERFGLDETSLRNDGFTGIYGSVCAYGHDGPWADRAGWEQLAQSTSGLCLDPLGPDKPVMLPGAATDYTTGFALAAGVMGALDAMLDDGLARRVDASLCQTAAWILRVGRLPDDSTSPSGFDPELLRSDTDFGVVEHLGPCVSADGLDIGWSRVTTPLGQGALTW